MFKGKKVLCIGERDGVPGSAIAECIKSAGGEPVLQLTQCFVWTAAGAMDLEDQGIIKKTVEEQDSIATVMVVLGSPDDKSAEMYAETVKNGDPTYAGPLAGVSLGLPVYHILEDEVKEHIDPEVYQQQVGMMEMVLDKESITRVVKKIREG